MITVRFPSGFSVQYNAATRVQSEEGNARFQRLKDANDKLIARIPFDCIVEFGAPCRTYDASTEATREKVWELSREVRLLKANIAKLTKEVVRLRK